MYLSNIFFFEALKIFRNLHIQFFENSFFSPIINKIMFQKTVAGLFSGYRESQFASAPVCLLDKRLCSKFDKFVWAFYYFKRFYGAWKFYGLLTFRSWDVFKWIESRIFLFKLMWIFIKYFLSVCLFKVISFPDKCLIFNVSIYIFKTHL